MCTGIVYITLLFIYSSVSKYMPILCPVFFVLFKNSIFHFYISKYVMNLMGIYIYPLKYYVLNQENKSCNLSKYLTNFLSITISIYKKMYKMTKFCINISLLIKNSLRTWPMSQNRRNNWLNNINDSSSAPPTLSNS